MSDNGDDSDDLDGDCGNGVIGGDGGEADNYDDGMIFIKNNIKEVNDKTYVALKSILKIFKGLA